jgi:hypothetical protein
MGKWTLVTDIRRGKKPYHWQLLKYRLEDSLEEYTCTVEEWETMELKMKLMAAGADEKDVEALYSLGYREGYCDGENQCEEST